LVSAVEKDAEGVTFTMPFCSYALSVKVNGCYHIVTVLFAINSIIVFVIIQLFLDKLSELKSHQNRQCVGLPEYEIFASTAYTILHYSGLKNAVKKSQKPFEKNAPHQNQLPLSFWPLPRYSYQHRHII